MSEKRDPAAQAALDAIGAKYADVIQPLDPNQPPLQWSDIKDQTPVTPVPVSRAQGAASPPSVSVPADHPVPGAQGWEAAEIALRGGRAGHRRHAVAFNALSRALSASGAFVALSDREAITRAVLTALENDEPQSGRFAEGYAAAIATLRDGDRYLAWWQSPACQPDGPAREHHAAYLESVGPAASEPTDTAETPDAAARRFAAELERLRAGLLDRNIQPDPWAPIDTGPVDTALDAIDRFLRLVQAAVEWRGRYVEAGSPDWSLHGPVSGAITKLLSAWPGVDLSVPAVTIAEAAAEDGPDLSDVLRHRLAQADTEPTAGAFNVEHLLANVRRSLTSARDDDDRAEAISMLLSGWYDTWPATAVTDPHDPLADELVRLLAAPKPSQGQDITDDQLLTLQAGMWYPGRAWSPSQTDAIRNVIRQAYRVGYAAALGCPITIGDLGDRLHIGDRP